MIDTLKTALSRAASSPNIGDISLMLANGATLDAIKTCPALLVKASTGTHLTDEELTALATAGCDLARLLGIKSPDLLAKVAPTPATPKIARVPVMVPIGKDSAGNNVSQVINLDNDPWGFILQTPVTRVEDKKNLRSLYNSMTARTQTKITEGYRAGLKALDVSLDKEIVKDAMKSTRTDIADDNMLDNVLSKKGFTVDRNESNKNLIDSFRGALKARGIEYSDDVHGMALQYGRDLATAYATRLAKGMQRRTIKA